MRTQPSAHPGPGRLVHVAIALLAGAVMGFELALVRIFSFTIWHHFAFMVISMALLGFGVSGVLLQVRPSLGVPTTGRAGSYAALYGVSSVVATVLACWLPLSPTAIAQEPTQWLYLLAFYLIFTVPFCFAGLAIITLLKGFGRHVDRLYGADLGGAGLCSLLSVLAMRPIGADGLVLTCAGLAALSGALLARSEARQPGSPRRKAPALAGLGAVFLALVPFAPTVVPVAPGPSKGMAQMLEQAPEARITHTEWSALGRVDVVEGGGGVTWTNNSRASTRSPAQALLIIDGDAGTPVIAAQAGPDDYRFLDYTLSSAAPQVFRPRRSLVLGSGGGVDVLTALHHGAEHVDAVEINEVVRDLVRGPYADFGGRLFYRDEVTLHASEGRSFIRNRDAEWDAIQLSLVDTWAASSSGAYALTEGYLYTVEAFEDYLQHLSEGGVLTLTRWLSPTPRESLRLMVVADQALRELGAQDPARHIVLIGLGNLGNLMVKREPFTPDELDRLRRVAGARGFRFLYAPGLQADNAFVQYFAARDRDAFVDRYPYDITAATDDSPFFFQFGRWSDVFGSELPTEMSTSGRGLLLGLLLQAVVVSLLLMVWPLVLLRRHREGPAAARPAGTLLAYFTLIGLAFMLVEISLMQRFTLYLGDPVYAVAFVLAVLLAAAGVGSTLSRRFEKTAAHVFLALIVLVALYAAVLPTVFEATLGVPVLGRFIIGGALLTPLGLLLGAPFPMAMTRLARVADGDGQLAGWAWAANGCASVLGPILASLLAFDLGFARVTLVSAMLYGLAFLAFRRPWMPASPAAGARATDA